MSLASTPSSRSSCLLNLPLELRSMIYSHLVPDTTIFVSTYSGPHPPFRKDGGACAPALFSVSRQIHDEMLEAWYENADAIYELTISQGKITLLGKPLQLEPNRILPDTLRRAKSLTINLSGIFLRDDINPSEDWIDQLHPLNRATGLLIQALVQNLQPGQCALQNFKLNIHVTLRFWLRSCRRDLARAQEAIDRNTCIFLGISGKLKNVEATFGLDPDSFRRDLPLGPRDFMRRRATELRPMFDEFEEKMRKQIT